MFTKTKKESQLNLYSHTNQFLSVSSQKVYEDSNSWHNLFREQVTMRIDEELFRPLFSQDNGAPNSSIRVLVSMMILKEAHGWSDSQLFEACNFNILVRSALGLFNMDDSLPANSTYYLLRRRIVEREKAGNENLMEKVFSQVTRSQAVNFQVNGKNIRMDSKLLGSNIAWYSRYELIHETLRKAYPYIKAYMNRLSLSNSDKKLLEQIADEAGDKVCYRSNQSDIAVKIADLGSLIYKITRQMRKHTSQEIQTLCRLFGEQYLKNKKDITPRSKEEISASSIQSPHDTECNFRNKDGNHKKGYSINVTETCDTEGALNLITNVQVDVAGAADCDFLQEAIEDSQEVVTQKIEVLNADGAFHSPNNQNYCKENEIELVLGAIQGKASRYDLLLDEKGELTVTDLQTGAIVSNRKIESRKEKNILKWAIKDDKGKNRYFTQKEIDTCLLRKQIAARPQAELNIRNNVEATIFQLGYHYPHDKSRYRGKIKHKIWANARCLWINFVRILKFILNSSANYAQIIQERLFLPQFMLKFVEMTILIQTIEKNNPIYSKIMTKNVF
jgi:hypothetical protein